MTEKNEELLAEAQLAGCSECSEEGTSAAMRCDGDLIRRLADALEAATRERADVPDAAPDGQVIIPIARIHELRAAKDAALAVVERIRQAVSGRPECDRYEEGDVISCGWKSAYASVVAALDGAPEPERLPVEGSES